MPYYACPGGNGSTPVAAAYVTGTQIWMTGATKRIKLYEIMVGAISNPNGTDTYIQFDVSRMTATGAGANTALTPRALDPADSAAIAVAGTNATAEATAITANSSVWNEGVNQRNSLRWVAPQESQYIVVPSVAANGLVMRAQSSTYVGTTSIQGTLQE